MKAAPSMMFTKNLVRVNEELPALNAYFFKPIEIRTACCFRCQTVKFFLKNLTWQNQNQLVDKG